MYSGSSPWSWESPQFSYDYGRSFHLDWSGGITKYSRAISAGAFILMHANGYWNLHEGHGWRPLLDANGARITRPLPTSVARAGSTLYCGYDNIGLFKLETSNIEVETHPPPAVADYQLSAAPNPFTAETALRYAFPSEASGELQIRDALGRIVFRSAQRSGNGTQRWNGRDTRGVALPSGVYFISLNSDGLVRTTLKLLLLR
jgi:hypothetical protein